MMIFITLPASHRQTAEKKRQLADGRLVGIKGGGGEAK
jgi:hypothetical protein